MNNTILENAIVSVLTGFDFSDGNVTALGGNNLAENALKLYRDKTIHNLDTLFRYSSKDKNTDLIIDCLEKNIGDIKRLAYFLERTVEKVKNDGRNQSISTTVKSVSPPIVKEVEDFEVFEDDEDDLDVNQEKVVLPIIRSLLKNGFTDVKTGINQERGVLLVQGKVAKNGLGYRWTNRVKKVVEQLVGVKRCSKFDFCTKLFKSSLNDEIKRSTFIFYQGWSQPKKFVWVVSDKKGVVTIGIPLELVSEVSTKLINVNKKAIGTIKQVAAIKLEANIPVESITAPVPVDYDDDDWDEDDDE